MRLTEMLHVSRSGYYAWTGRVNRVSKSRQRREKLLKKIHDAHLQSRRLYGSPQGNRMWPPVDASSARVRHRARANNLL